MAWTEQQTNAIEIRNASVIVSAAAGSGKTAVLTERLARLISDENAHVRADRIIAVTFTNDAASELRKRLDSKLRAMISEDPGNSYLIRQQTLLQSARISTINAFCFELLRDNITEQGITPGFSVLDENENELIKSQAMDEMINFYSREEYDKISFMYDKFCLKSDEQLAEVINAADCYLSSAAMRDKWLDDAVNACEGSPFESIYGKKLYDSALTWLKKAAALAEQCREMLNDVFYGASEIPAAVKSFTQADDDRMRTEKALKIFESGKIPAKDEIEYCTGFAKLVTVRKAEGVDTDYRELYKLKRAEIISLTNKAMHIFDGFEEDFSENGKVVCILAEMLRKYQSLIWEKKCEKNAISFDDGERLVLELLADTDENGNIVQSEAALKIAGYYDIIMIDEYQDSNNKQDLIFKLISKNYHLNYSGEPVYGNNAFVVGDVKQSIYRFRLANPRNFIDTLKNSEPFFNGKESDNYSVSLNRNFRSSAEVIDFANFVFSKLMSEKCGDVVYNDNEKLYFGAGEYSRISDTNCLTHIAFINTDEDDRTEEDEETGDSVAGINPEAVYTASKIFAMLQNKEPVVMKDGTCRPCEPSDFCILIRKNSYAKDFVSELRKYGIEVRSEEEKGYLKSREIAVLLDLLRIIDNPLLDVPLTAVMMSPMYMFELEEIAFLKALDQSQSLFTIMTDLVNNKYEECEDIFLGDRCSDFLNALNSFRLAAVTMTVGELINRIYDTTDFLSVMQLYSDGEKKRANLRVLVQHAKNYESAASFEGSGGLSGFVRYIDRVIGNGRDFEQGKISSVSGNYVSVKTIHKSKGLEYPFVFLAEMSSKIQRKEKPAVICSDDSRLGFTLYNHKLVRRYRTISYNLILEENVRDTASEEMRLLYVAITRAKQKLFINLKCGKKRRREISKLIETYFLENADLQELAQYAKCHADWIWFSLFEHTGFKEIAEKSGIDVGAFGFPAVRNKENIFETEFFSSGISESASEPPEVEEAHPDNDICRELREIIDYDYDRLLSETPAKLSVTQITKKFSGTEEPFDFKLKRPKFTAERTNLTGAERGTAIHTFFQYCDFDAARDNPEAEIERMVERGYLSRPQADSIDTGNAEAFFKSDLYRRISKSRNIMREKKFMVAVADLDIESQTMEAFRKSDGMIKGIADLIFEENGSLVLVDYKSDIRASEETLKERYKMQLRLYKSAVELTTARTVAEVYLYSFELKKEIRIEL